MKYPTILLLLALAGPAAADDGPAPTLASEEADQTVYVVPNVPDEEGKIRALKRAYEINGNRMVGAVDLTAMPVPVEAMQILPVADPNAKNRLDEAADLNTGEARKFSRAFNAKADVCARHHMHKVATGTSWRCRK
jgi:hypothetical protein